MSDPHTTAPPFSPDELPVLTEEDNVWHGAVNFDASLRLLMLARETQMLVWYSPSRLRVNLEEPRSCGAPSCSVSNSVHTEQLGVAAAIADNRCWPLYSN